MVSRNLLIFLFISYIIFPKFLWADITINELIFDDTKPIHLKILETLPKEAILQVGADDAENTIIEFMDYLCGYCKKIQPELIELAQKRDDVRVIFLQHPILGESSYLIAKMVIAANLQNKGLELHNNIFTTQGSLTNEKLMNAVTESELNQVILKIDSEKSEVKKIIQLSSFLAGGVGARGTPSLFINEYFSGGYLSKEQIINLLK